MATRMSPCCAPIEAPSAKTNNRPTSEPPSTISPEDPSIEDQSQPSRKRNGLAIGAPITAALIGGALVFENLVHAEEANTADTDSGVAFSETEALLSLEPIDGLDEGASSLQINTKSHQTTSEDARAAIEELEAPSVEAHQAPMTSSSSQAQSIQAAGSSDLQSLQAGQAIDDGGAGAATNVFNIDVSTEAFDDTTIEAYVEEEALGRNTIIGSPGDDVLEGTEGHDNIIGASGDDVIFGRGGNDILNGNEGDDELHGGIGKDKLFGGSGNDFLEGGDDHDLDQLRGGIGDDVLVVNGVGDLALERFNEQGDDLQIVRDGYAEEKGTSAEGTTFVFAANIDARNPLPEGAAADIQSMATGIENLTFEGDVDYDAFADDYDNRLTGNNGDNLLHAGAGNDVLAGGAGDDRLIGGEGFDDLSGDAGDDILDGGEHDDVLRGGAGDDHLIGGSGKDELFGGAGNDDYSFGLNDVAIDSVFDHEGANRLVLEGVTDETIEVSILGDDLYVTADRTPIAMVNDYVGHEDTIAGIDFGQGLKTVESLLVENPDLAAAITEIETKQAEAIANDPRFAHDDLTEPTWVGTNNGDYQSIHTDTDDWLSGLDGKDNLYGNAGNDILEGGGGQDNLYGGAGNDRYLFKAEDRGGVDFIQDVEGHNLAEIQGFGRHAPEATVFGNDLRVSVDDTLLFAVKDFVGNEDAFVGVQAGERFYETDDLLA